MLSNKLTTLLQEMTTKEKVGQLMQLAPFFFKENIIGEITGPMRNLGITNKDIGLAGSVLGIGGAKEMKEIQSSYLNNSRLGIPLMFMADVVHGYKTIYPIPLALGCSWDTNLVEDVASYSASEASAGGVHVTFSPMVDLVRDPRWGRVMESTGEDPYLNKELARAFVRGYQGNDISKDGNIASCVKHFAAYGAPEGGRDYNTVDISQRMLHEFYFPAYEAAIDEGAKMVMTAFNIVDSVPATGNQWLLKNILREKWGFEGVIISDYNSVHEMIDHGYSENEYHAAKQAIEATLDIEMMSGCYIKNLERLVEEHKIDPTLIDDAVKRILVLKEEIGLFDNPYKGASEEKENTLILSDLHRDLSRKAAAKSCVLLKNNGSLPLRKDVKIAIVGPYAEEHSIIGPWSWQGNIDDTISLRQGIENKVGKDQIIVETGCDIEGNIIDMEKALQAVESADICILALGEDQKLSGEGGSRTSITLPKDQTYFARKILDQKCPAVVTLFNGRPLDLGDISEKADAILETWFPGTEGGNGIADLLFGDVNPSGKLSMSFPRNVGQIPVYYNAFSTGRPIKRNKYYRYESHYLDCPNDPLYSFGYGLSYSTFSYSDLTTDKSILHEDETVNVKIKVQNISNVPGEEIVQLYIKDSVASTVRPVQELKAFKKVKFEANEQKIVSFSLNAANFEFYNQKHEKVVEDGEFIIMIGNSSNSTMSQKITYKKFINASMFSKSVI